MSTTTTAQSSENRPDAIASRDAPVRLPASPTSSAPGSHPADIIGLHTVLGILPGTTVFLVWKNLDEVVGIPTFPARRRPSPTARVTLTSCSPERSSTTASRTRRPLYADRGARAGWVGGSCGGSLLTGAARLLRGYRATTNFHQLDLLPYFGAIPAEGDVVVDRSRITAGPFTGSIDIALRLVQQQFYGDELAREMELQFEYAPPLFGVGSPALAGPELTAQALAHGAEMGKPSIAVAERAAPSARGRDRRGGLPPRLPRSSSHRCARPRPVPCTIHQ